MSTLNKKVKSRESNVKSIEKLFNNVNKPEVDTTLIESTIETIEAKFKKVVIINEEIEDSLTDKDDVEKFVDEATDIELFIRTKINTLKKIIKSPSTDVVTSTTSTKSKAPENTYSKLPKLEITKFDGNFLHWHTFYDSFKAVQEVPIEFSNFKFW